MNLDFIPYEAHTHVSRALIHNAFIEKGYLLESEGVWGVPNDQTPCQLWPGSNYTPFYSSHQFSQRTDVSARSCSLEVLSDLPS